VVEDVPLEGVARDATTLLEVLQAFADVGFDGSFQAAPGARVRCLRCDVEVLRALAPPPPPAKGIAV
jgi:hypothetical protein